MSEQSDDTRSCRGDINVDSAFASG